MPIRRRRFLRGRKGWIQRQQFSGNRQERTEAIIRMYESGYSGAEFDSESRLELADSVEEISGSDLCTSQGLAGSGKGQLSLPFLAAAMLYPNCYPGAPQERGDCWPAGTMVSGDEIKPIEDIEVGDFVWSGEGARTEVVSTRKLKTYKPCVTINAVGMLPMKCTSDHKMLVYRMARISGKRVNPNYYARAMEGKARLSSNNKTAVIECYEKRSPEWVAAGDLKDTDCLLSPVSYEAVPAPKSPRFILNDREGRFTIGYFMGNGHASGHSVEFSCTTLEIAKRIGKLLSSLGWHVQPIAPDRGAYRVRISDVKFVQWCRDNFYDKDGAKKFPGWAVSNKEIFEGLVLADGHGKGRIRNFDSTSKSLIWGVYASLCCFGYEPTVSEVVRSEGTYDNAKPLYRINWRDEKEKQYTWRDDRYVCRPVRSIEWHEDEEIVYDIGVKDRHHSFVANGHSTHNCVSHGAAGAELITIANEVLRGLPDEISGEIEGAPEVPDKGRREGVVSMEYKWWTRRRSGDGWSCSTAAKMTLKEGVMLKKPYPDLNIDLTDYTYSSTAKYARSGPPANVLAKGREHLIRDATEADSMEATRDLLANNFGMFDCGGQGFSRSRDANGVSRRSGSWAHSMKVGGFDDRQAAYSAYGGPLCLIINNWGKWNSGPRDIMNSAKFVPDSLRQRWIEIDIVNPETGNIMIPQGAFWARWKDVSSRYRVAYSGANGWKAQANPWLTI